MPDNQVIDRTHAVKSKKGPQPCRYEVVMYHSAQDWEDDGGTIIAKFQCAGDAFAWAKSLNVAAYRFVVRN